MGDAAGRPGDFAGSDKCVLPSVSNNLWPILEDPLTFLISEEPLIRACEESGGEQAAIR